MMSIAVLCHLYYKDSAESLVPYLKNLEAYNTRFLFNLCCDTTYYQELRQRVCQLFQNPILTGTPNVGKDIGGKLALLDTFLKLELDSDYIIFLHDKKSPHTTTGAAWRQKLLAILEPQNINKISGMFLRSEETGLIANGDLILNEYDPATKQYNCTSNAELQVLRARYGIHTDSHDFIGGTMFWARASVYRNFFTTVDPLQVRSTLEKGNILDHHAGTRAHAWERMLSWIVLNSGFKIKGI
jgi:lipopolysaccharide biosynthesis protein